MFRKSALLGSSTLSSAPQTTYADIRGEDIMTDPRVIADVRAEFEDRGIYIADDDELMRKFYDDQTFSKLNATIGPYNAYQRAQAATPDSRARQARLRDAHGKLPAFFQSGGVGAATAIPSYLKAIVLDPINAVGGFVGVGGKAVAKSVQVARMTGKSPAVAAARTAATRTALYEGAFGAGFGGAYSVGQQNVDIKLGLQDEFSMGRLVADVAGEAAFSAGLGAAIGGTAGAIFKGRFAGQLDNATQRQVIVDAIADAEAEGDYKLQDSLMERLDHFDDLIGRRKAAEKAAAAAPTTTAADETPPADTTPPTEETPPADTTPAAEETPPSQAEETAPDPDAPAVVRTGGLSVNARALAEENGIDVSIDERTGAYNNPQLEAMVQERAKRNDMPVHNSVNVTLIKELVTQNVSETNPAQVAAANLYRDMSVTEAAGVEVTKTDIDENVKKVAAEGNMSPDEVRAALDELMAARIAEITPELTARADAAKALEATLTRTEKGKVTRRVKKLVKEQGLSEGEAKLQALEEIERGRGSTGTTPKRMTRTETAADAFRTQENAGRSLTDVVDPETMRTTRQPGGLQAVFKGTILPTKGSIARNTAKLEAEKTGALTAFVAKAGQRAMTKSGRIEMLPRGSAIIYDPVSEGFYGGGTLSDAQAAVEVRYRNDEVGIETKRAIAENREAVVARAESEGKVNYIDFGATAKNQEAQGTANVPATRGEGILTLVWNRDDIPVKGEAIRQLSKKQREAGKGISDLIGSYTAADAARSPNKNRENWTIYYAPEGTAKEIAEVLPSLEPIPYSAFLKPAVDTADPVAGPPPFTEIADELLPAPETEAEQALFQRYREQGLAMDTYQNLLTRENELLDAAFSNYSDVRAYINDMSTLLGYMDRVLPMGVKYMTGTREAAQRAIFAMGDKYSLETMELLSRMIDGAAGGAPILRFQSLPGDVNGRFTNPLAQSARFKGSDVETRTTKLGEEVAVAAGAIDIDPDSQIHPAHLLLHELAHWSMSFVMTPRMKLEFFAELTNYITPDGKLDLKALGLADAPAGMDVGSNSKEVFANMFTMYASNKRFRSALESKGNVFFDKIRKVIAAVKNFFMGNVPEAFDPIFAPIMSDVDARRYFISDINNQPADPTARAIQRRALELDELRAVWRETISEDGNLEATTERTLSFLHSLSNTKAENARLGAATGAGATGNNTGPFDPLNSMMDRIRGTIKSLRSVQDTAIDPVELEAMRAAEIAAGVEPGAYSVSGLVEFDDVSRRAVTKIYNDEVVPLFEDMAAQLDDRFQTYALGQAQGQRVLNRKRNEAKPLPEEAPAPTNKAKSRKQRAQQLQLSAFNKTRAAATDEQLAQDLERVGLSPDASMEEVIAAIDYSRAEFDDNKVVAQRLKRMVDAQPVTQGRNKYDGQQKPALFKMLVDAAERNDLNEATQIAAAYSRAGGTDKIAPQDAMVDNLIAREAKDGVLTLDGVALNARAQIRRLQELMNSRNNEGQANSRQLFYRLMNMLGATEGELIREGDLAPIFGQQAQGMSRALSADSEVFRSLRTKLRAAAQGLTGGEDTIPDLIKMAIRTSNDLPVDTINGEPADEFMTKVVTELLANRATFDQVFPSSPNRAALLQAARNYMDRTGYLVNGLIGSESLRKKYPGLTIYGDMFANNHRRVTSTNGIGGVTAPQVAADAFTEALTHGTQRLRAGIQKFTRGAFNLMPDGTPAALYVPVRRGNVVDHYGRPQTKGQFGLATYVSPDPVGALRTKTGDIPARTGMEEIADDLLARVINIDERISVLRGQAAVAPTAIEANALRDDIIEALANRERMLERLDQTGRTFDDVAPVITSARTMANFQEAMPYYPDHPMVGLLGGITADASKQAGQRFEQGISGVIDGDDLYALAVDAMERSGMSADRAKAIINRGLKDNGYDGILGTIDDEGLARPIAAIFNGENVRSLKSPDLPVDVVEDAIAPTGIGSQFFDLVASENQLPPASAAALEDHFNLAGIPKALSSSMAQSGTKSRGRNPLMKGWDVIMAGADGRLRRAGMEWLADSFDRFTVDQTIALGQKLMPVVDGLNQLPGMPKNLLGKMGNYLRQGMQGNKLPLMPAFEEPAPMRRIRAALIDESKIANLRGAAEQEMFAKIQGLFQQQLRMMQAEGILVGDLGPSYYPQVWNPDIVARDPEGFKSLMIAYFQREQPNASGDEAKQFADKIFTNITEGDTGVVDLDAVGASMTDSVSFARMLNFHKQAPELLESAERFMEQSLMATMARYFDQTERAIQQAKHLGIHGHMVSDYAKSAQEGMNGMIEVMSTDRIVTTKKKTVMAGDGGVLEEDERFKIKMLDRAAADAAVKAALEKIRGGGDVAAAEAILIAANKGASKSSPHFQRRARAVAAAMADFPDPTKLMRDDINAAEGYSRLLMRKPLGSWPRYLRSASRNVRMFNNITLLPFSTITSFSDLALPIIRTGDFKAAWRGWTKYLGDDDYRNSIREIGVAIDGLVHERMAQLIGDPSNMVQSTFFKMIGLTPWTNLNRAGSAAIGHQAMTHHMNALKKMGAQAKGSPAYNYHDRFLKKHGLNYDASQPVPDITDENVKRAVIRFVDNTIFSPKPQDMPLYAATPWGAMIAQLKSFSIMYGRFFAEIMGDFKPAFGAVAAGDFNTARKYMTRPALLMTLGPAVAAGSIATKDVVMGRGGDEGQSFGLNTDRRFSQFIGKEWADEDLDAMAGWYLQSFLQAGGAGLLGDLFITTAEQQSNGAYGRERITETILGPSYGLANDMLKVGEAAIDAATGGDSAGVQRQGVREIVSRVPVVGGIRPLREGAVDLVREADTKSSGVGGGPFKRTTYGTTNF